MRGEEREALMVAANIEDLQLQRQRVLSVTMAIVEALRFGKSFVPLDERFVMLCDEVRALFAIEDRAMVETGFPSIDAHQLDHAWLITVLTELHAGARQLPESSAALEEFAQRFRREFSSRMTNHAQSLDRELSSFLGTTRGSPSSEASATHRTEID